MKSSAKILFITGILIASTLLFFLGSTTIIMLVTFGIAAILDFVFMLESKTNKKLLWVHIIPLMGVAGVIVYYFLKWGLTSLFNFVYVIPIAANILSFCALLVHIDHSIKQKKIKDLEAEISRLKG